MKHYQFMIWNTGTCPRTWRVALRLIGLALILPCLAARAAEPQQTNGSSGRYLLVVDTSSSMRRYAENTRKVVNDLLLSSMNGQLHRGDTIGVWTFNEELHTGGFPLQQWTPETREKITTNTVDFLKSRSYEKKGQLENVFPALARLVKGSEKITILLVTGGDTKITGLPFEAQINRAYEAGRAEMRKLREPFVVVLRGWHGRLLGGTANGAQWPVDFPQFPPDPPKKEPVKEAAAGSKPAPQPLIVIGKKPEPLPLATSPAEQTGIPPETTVTPTSEVMPPSQTPPQVETPVEPQPASLQSPVERESPPAQTAAAFPPEAKSNRTVLLLAGLAALVIGLGLAFILMRRFRGSSSASLITRSMDREKD